MGGLKAPGAVRVIFRMWHDVQDGHGVIALFPDEPWGGPDRVSSFDHIHMHGVAEYAGVMARTRAATPEEYARLKRELEDYPYRYNLAVIQHKSDKLLFRREKCPKRSCVS